jgi:hypothetical protein
MALTIGTTLSGGHVNFLPLLRSDVDGQRPPETLSPLTVLHHYRECLQIIRKFEQDHRASGEAIGRFNSGIK